jgi:ribonuclease Z
MTSTLVVGESAQDVPAMSVPGAERLAPGEIRVSVLGGGDPWIRRSQAWGSLLIEVGNPEKDLFFDLGLRSLADFTSLMLPLVATAKVFLSHLHADHVGDVPRAGQQGVPGDHTGWGLRFLPLDAA